MMGDLAVYCRAGAGSKDRLRVTWVRRRYTWHVYKIIVCKVPFDESKDFFLSCRVASTPQLFMTPLISSNSKVCND